MVRHVALAMIALPLAGCIDGSASPGSLPKGVASGVYTVAPPQALASCLAAAWGATVRADGDRLVVAPHRRPDLSYSIGPNRRDSVYPTQVAIVGNDAGTPEARALDACLQAGVPGRSS